MQSSDSKHSTIFSLTKMTEEKYSDNLLSCYIPLQWQSLVNAFPVTAFAQGCALRPTDKSAGKQPFRAVARFLTQLPLKSWTASTRWKRMGMGRLTRVTSNSTHASQEYKHMWLQSKRLPSAESYSVNNEMSNTNPFLEIWNCFFNMKKRPFFSIAMVARALPTKVSKYR